MYVEEKHHLFSNYMIYLFWREMGRHSVFRRGPGTVCMYVVASLAEKELSGMT